MPKKPEGVKYGNFTFPESAELKRKAGSDWLLDVHKKWRKVRGWNAAEVSKGSFERLTERCTFWVGRACAAKADLVEEHERCRLAAQRTELARGTRGG